MIGVSILFWGKGIFSLLNSKNGKFNVGSPISFLAVCGYAQASPSLSLAFGGLWLCIGFHGLSLVYNQTYKKIRKDDILFHPRKKSEANK